jgi:GNAT superfamily N-acetyltransferase
MTKYFDELDSRFVGGFDRTGALGFGAVAMGPPHGVFLVAVSGDGAVVGCGGVQRHAGDTAEIKRMWIDLDWRGAGIGRRLLAELETCAAATGYSRVVLDTNSTLKEAIAMYESAGYRLTDRYNDNPYAQRWFSKDLAPPDR